MPDELKPCPWCEKEPTVGVFAFTGANIYCVNMNCPVRPGVNEESGRTYTQNYINAKNRWNNRK